MNIKKRETFYVRYWLITALVVSVISTYLLTFSQDLDSPVNWEMRLVASMLLFALAALSLYALHRIINVSAWYGVIAFVFMVIMLFLGIRIANSFTAATISDLGTAHLFLRMPIAIVAGLFGGVGSLLLSRAFWARGRGATNFIVSGYFALTGIALMLGYFLIDALSGFIRLVSLGF